MIESPIHLGRQRAGVECQCPSAGGPAHVHEVPPDPISCGDCGTALELTCPGCGKKHRELPKEHRCRGCNVVLEYSGRGRPPRWCGPKMKCIGKGRA